MDILIKVLDYGTAIVAIVGIIFMAREFLKAQDKKDNRFLEIITNHLNEQKKSMDANTSVLIRLENLIKDVLLRSRNGKKK